MGKIKRKNKDKTRKRKNKDKTRKRNSNIKRKNIVKHKSKNNRKTYKMKRNNSNKRRKKIRNKTREKKYKIINQMGGSGDGGGAGGGEEEVVVDLSSINISWEVSRLEQLQSKLRQGNSTIFDLFKTSYRNNPYIRQLRQLKDGTEIIGGPTTNAGWDAVPLLDCLERAMGWEDQFIYGPQINTRPNTDKRTRYTGFIDTYLQFIVDRALDLRILGDLKAKISEYLSSNEQGGRVLTQEECLCIISNSFLSTWKEEGRTSPPNPNCNYAKMFQSYGVDPNERVWKEINAEMKVQKCMALMEYFMKRKSEYDSSAGREKLRNTVVKFQLIEVTGDIEELATRCENELLQVNMMPVIPLGATELKWEAGEEEKYNKRFTSESKPVPTNKLSARIIDDPRMKPHSLNVDFANEAIGGGAMDYGHVQEEELFTLHTDYCCAGLFCRVMEANQAILLSGGEQIAENRTHDNRKLWNIEPYSDDTATRIELEREESGKLMFPMYTTAIDALDFRRGIEGNPLLGLYSTENFLRELTKCYAGLRADDMNISYIRTGNFGGGAFLPHYLFRRDDNARQDYIVFKGLIQLLAASMHGGNNGKQLDYCPFNEGRVSSILLELSKKLRGSEIKANELFNILRSKCANYQLLGDYIRLRIDGSSDIDIFKLPTLIDETMWTKSDKCWITGSDFTMFNGRHHCRHCGRSVSGGRSSRTLDLIDKFGSTQNARVCDFCYTLLSGGKPIWQYAGDQGWIDYGNDYEGKDISYQITEFVINNPEGYFPVTINRLPYTIDPFQHRQVRQDDPELWRGVMLKGI